ncbi:DNA primase small subunit-like protein, partial [Trifolium pratense]
MTLVLSTYSGSIVDVEVFIVGLTNEQRASIADYFRVYKGNEKSHNKVSLMGAALHPFLA